MGCAHQKTPTKKPKTKNQKERKKNMTTRIKIEDGQETSIYRTSAQTIGELFADSDFREDFNVSTRALPTVNGSVVDGETEIAEDMTIGWQLGASSKS